MKTQESPKNTKPETIIDTQRTYKVKIKNTLAQYFETKNL